MLRAIIQVFAFVCLFGAIVLVTIEPAAWPALAAAALLVLGTLWERFHYRGSAGGGAGWQVTQERFRDDESGNLVTVWFNPATGERRYVDEGVTPPA
jgi:hypothetical protein